MGSLGQESPTQEFHTDVDGVKVVFKSFPLPDERIVHGNVFPLGLSISRESGGQITLDEGADAIRELSKQGITTKLLNTHGAVIIRGVHDPSPHAFSVMIHAAEEGRGHAPYDQLGLAGSRVTHDKEVFSASEAPPYLWIHQHNEYSRYTKFPSNIHFFCHKAPEEGGESPFAHSAEFYDRVKAELPQFVEDLATKKLISPDVYRAPGKEAANFSFTWAGPLAFGRDIKDDDDMATKKKKAEIQAARLTPHFWWLDDDQLEVHQHVEGISRHPATKKPVWFNSMAGRYGTALDRNATDPPYIGDDGMAFPPAMYRDGSEIPKEYLHRMWEISTEILVKVKTEPGDLALVDNYQVSHGRVPWSKGERKILVSMWDTQDSKEKILPY